MDTYLKISGVVIVAIVLGLVLSNYRKDVAILLSIAMCCILGISVINQLHPIFDFFNKLKKLGNFDVVLLSTLAKCVGIGILGDITATICNDAGNGSVGKILQLLSTIIILSLSVPIFEKLLSLIQEIFTNI